LTRFNGLLCISNKVAQDISGIACQRLGDHSAPFITSFRLGLTKLLDGVGVIRPELKAIISAGRKLVIMVGTVERRKGYQLFADIAKVALDSRIDCMFCAVGRPGNDEFAKRQMTEMPSDNFFWFQDLSDLELGLLYESSAVFLNTTFDEGYGLPVVESVQMGARLLLPRIPIFEEICGEAACYYDSRDPKAIADILGRLLSGEEIHEQFDFSKIPEWPESLRELIDKIELGYKV
jgi:glycosyltransferase involved in cell wall biosynthesis